MSSIEEQRAKSNARVKAWRARNPERARAQTKEALKRYNENMKIERNALRAEIKRLKKIIAKLQH